MNLGALLQSLILTLAIFFLILLDYKRLVAFFLQAKPDLPLFAFKQGSTKNLIRV
jgi:hypothetical protein